MNTSLSEKEAKSHSAKEGMNRSLLEEEAPWLQSQCKWEGINSYLPEAPWLESHCEREGVN